MSDNKPNKFEIITDRVVNLELVDVENNSFKVNDLVLLKDLKVHVAESDESLKEIHYSCEYDADIISKEDAEKLSDIAIGVIVEQVNKMVAKDED